MAKPRRRYYDSYYSVKGKSGAVNKRRNRVHPWDVEDEMLNPAESVLNQRRRSRVGHVERSKKR